MILGQARTTQLMILINLFEGKNKPAELAKELGITIPGVRYHIKILREKGFVSEDNALTKEGFESLYSGLNSVRQFVSDNMTKLDKVITWEALCDEPVRKGEKVYLHMKDGYLHASKKTESASTGRAETDCDPPDVIGVSDVEGMIDVRVRDFAIFVLPDVEIIDSKDDIAKLIREKFEMGRYDHLGILGEEAKLIADKAGIRADFQYAPIDAAFESATRGQSTMVLISRRRFHFMLPVLKELENRNPGIVANIDYI